MAVIRPLRANYHFEAEKVANHTHSGEHAHLYSFTVPCTATHKCDLINNSQLSTSKFRLWENVTEVVMASHAVEV